MRTSAVTVGTLCYLVGAAASLWPLGWWGVAVWAVGLWAVRRLTREPSPPAC